MLLHLFLKTSSWGWSHWSHKNLGFDLAWQDDFIFLGVYLTKTIPKSKFVTLNTNPLKRPNLIKAVSSVSRSACSFNLIKIVNSLVSSLIDYCCFIYVYLSTTSYNILESIYAALCFPFGLPKWTPILVLHREINRTPFASASNLSAVSWSVMPHLILQYHNCPLSSFCSSINHGIGMHCTELVKEILWLSCIVNIS